MKRSQKHLRSNERSTTRTAVSAVQKELHWIVFYRTVLQYPSSVGFVALSSRPCKFSSSVIHVITVSMNVIILAFYYFISKSRWGICVSHLICFTSFLCHRGRPQRESTFQPFSSSPLSSHFSSLVLFPRLRAEEPQCLLLTFSYHLSPFHRHNYLHPLSVFCSWLPVSRLLSSSHTICLFQAHQYSPSPADSW